MPVAVTSRYVSRKGDYLPLMSHMIPIITSIGIIIDAEVSAISPMLTFIIGSTFL